MNPVTAISLQFNQSINQSLFKIRQPEPIGYFRKKKTSAIGKFSLRMKMATFMTVLESAGSFQGRDRE